MLNPGEGAQHRRRCSTLANAGTQLPFHERDKEFGPEFLGKVFLTPIQRMGYSIGDVGSFCQSERNGAFPRTLSHHSNVVFQFFASSMCPTTFKTMVLTPSPLFLLLGKMSEFGTRLRIGSRSTNIVRVSEAHHPGTTPLVPG